MCVSNLAQVVYGLGCALAIGLLVASAVTPGWRSVDMPNSTKQAKTGLFRFACSFPGDKDDAGVDEDEYCRDWWKVSERDGQFLGVLFCGVYCSACEPFLFFPATVFAGNQTFRGRSCACL